jgi:NitT/TauT family transport system substrate-binding protein
LTGAVQRAVHWMREHSAQEIRGRMPAQYRATDSSADVEALQAMVGMLSPEGRMPPAGAEAVRKVLAVSSEKVRTAPIDVAKVFTNEFVAPRQ